MNAETGAAAYAIERVHRIGDDRKAEKRQQLPVEGACGWKIPNRDERMGDTIDLHVSPHIRFFLLDPVSSRRRSCHQTPGNAETLMVATPSRSFLIGT